MRITIAGFQASGHPGDAAANLAALRSAARAAVDRGVDLLITTEMYVTGYNIPADVDALSRRDLVGEVGAIAREERIAILAGLPERTDAGIANSAVFLDETGAVLGRHHKTHLFGNLDRGMFAAGDRLVSMVEYRGVKIAMLICYDVEFPESVRAAALAGADLVAVPTAQMTPYEFIAESVIRTRAWENQVYLAYVNHAGSEGDIDYVGRSSIVDPGAVVLEGIVDGDGLIVADIDTDVVAAARAANPYLADTRPTLYESRVASAP